ncbi:uncharacterized protein LOC143909960 [Arctopsyche grandis]|uniref:uncharacterized protein LOC143909960 n=1 Tax=Arctopsyche grandis TaxID=121162 RepID=UPI00406D77B4
MTSRYWRVAASLAWCAAGRVARWGNMADGCYCAVTIHRYGSATFSECRMSRIECATVDASIDRALTLCHQIALLRDRTSRPIREHFETIRPDYMNECGFLNVTYLV